MVTFILLAAVALCALLIGLVVVTVGDKTPAVAATTAESAKADSHSSWAAVRAQILWTLGAESTAKRAQHAAAAQRRAAKRHRRWIRRATAAEGRAKALAEAKTTRLEARRAAKAEAREKSRAVAQRHGHAVARRVAIERRQEAAALASGQEAVQAHRRLVAAGLATPVALPAGIKAAKRAERGGTVVANAQKREARMVAAQQRNAAARVAADAANVAFATRTVAKAEAQAVRAAWVDQRREELGPQREFVWTAAGAKAALAEAKAAAKAAKAAKLAAAKALASVTWEQTQEARRVLWLGRKALAKAELIAWLEAGNGQASKAAAACVAELEAQAEEAVCDFWADTGVSPELAADRGAVRAARRQVAA